MGIANVCSDIVDLWRETAGAHATAHSVTFSVDRTSEARRSTQFYMDDERVLPASVYRENSGSYPLRRASRAIAPKNPFCNGNGTPAM